jgi:hypothetical protein
LRIGIKMIAAGVIAVAGLMKMTTPAQAAVISYAFSGTIDESIKKSYAFNAPGNSSDAGTYDGTFNAFSVGQTFSGILSYETALFMTLDVQNNGSGTVSLYVQPINISLSINRPSGAFNVAPASGCLGAQILGDNLVGSDPRYTSTYNKTFDLAEMVSFSCNQPAPIEEGYTLNNVNVAGFTTAEIGATLPTYISDTSFVSDIGPVLLAADQRMFGLSFIQPQDNASNRINYAFVRGAVTNFEQVPEPASISLMALGLLGLGMRYRRKGAS